MKIEGVREKMMRKRWVCAVGLVSVMSAVAQTPQPVEAPAKGAYDAVPVIGALYRNQPAPRMGDAAASPIVEGKRALAAKDFAGAKKIFAEEVKTHPASVEAQMGLGDAELGLHEYEAAELVYRGVVQIQPEMWPAHKNLVIIEAALGRWEEFDRERALLRGARERGAPGISARESDVIDGFTVAGKRWIVREYFVPAGRSMTRYNFEHFSPEGKAEEYVSLESEEAAKKVVPGGAVAIGGEAQGVVKDFALNWYTGKGHGSIARYPGGEPKYEKVRARVMAWLRAQAAHA